MIAAKVRMATERERKLGSVPCVDYSAAHNCPINIEKDLEDGRSFYRTFLSNLAQKRWLATSKSWKATKASVEYEMVLVDKIQLQVAVDNLNTTTRTWCAAIVADQGRNPFVADVGKQGAAPKRFVFGRIRRDGEKSTDFSVFHGQGERNYASNPTNHDRV